MKPRRVTLYVGIVHQKDDQDDFADIRFITLSKEQADKEMCKVKDYATVVLKLHCVVDSENYVLYKSLNEHAILESFYAERILIIKGDSNE